MSGSFPIPLRLVLTIMTVLAIAADGAAQRPLKVYISADMEGVAGAVTAEQLGPAGFEYQRFREVMTSEVLAAIEGARAAGATEIVVSDSHGNGQNLLLDRLPDDVPVIRSWPRPLGMMAGIDSTFDAAIFIGYHASAANPQGVRAHTFSSALLADVKLNGRSASEAAVNAAIAGHFGVPVVMVSGDDATVAEVRELLGDVEGAVVKRALGFHAAASMAPSAAWALIRETAERALRRLDDFRPYRLARPIELEVTFKHYRPAEVLDYLEIVERVGSRTIRYSAADAVRLSNFLVFLLNYEPGLQP